jgi:hypothetical protein
VTRHVVRLSDPDAVDDLVEALDKSRTEVQRRGSRTIVLSDRGHDDDLETELLFFLKAWALSHPAVQFELYRRSRRSSQR